ncbi:MAG TPA: 50S ribosomal protein L4 [Actinomycetota bacterium]|jgi:large subunit ribosomal protein L4
MATVDVRDAQGKVLEQRELPADFFDAPINPHLMHQVVVAGLAAARAGTHSTKTRAEVAGGGRKPWRQKGTGRARQGSIRAPQWVGGGVAHGPKPRSYEMRVNKKMKRSALRSALTDALHSGKLAVVGSLAFDGPRTKDARGVLDALGLDGRVLLVLAGPDEAVEKSFRNLSNVKIEYPRNISTYDVLHADQVLFTAEALDVLGGSGGSSSEAKPSVAPRDEEGAK